MIHGTLDHTAPLPEGSPETSADYGYGCLVCSAALPVARRGPMPVYCRRCARRLQNLRARSGSVPADPRSPVPRQRLEAAPRSCAALEPNSMRSGNWPISTSCARPRVPPKRTGGANCTDICKIPLPVPGPAGKTLDINHGRLLFWEEPS